MTSVDYRLRLVAACLMFTFGGFAVPAQAQDQTGAAAAADTLGLEEVVVTAQRREQRLIDVPIAVTALSAEQLENRGLTDVTGLNALAPNLQVTISAGSRSNTQVGIRGSLEINSNLLIDPTVGLYVDGVFISKAVGAVFDMLDLQRVEVLRGPQGTLYGRNTLAGAINFVTKRPSGEFKGTAGISLGNYNARVLRASVDLPSVGIVNASISGRMEERDGWVKVVPDPFGNYTGPTRVHETMDANSDSGRLALDFNFSDAFHAEYRLDASNSNQNHVYDQIIYINEAFFSGFGIPFADYVHPRSDRRDSYSTNLRTLETNRVMGHALTFVYDVSDSLTLKSITGYREFARNDRQDQDGSPLDIGETTLNINYHGFSQEFQAIGKTDRFNYTAGLYYSDDGGYAINYLNFFGLFGPFGSKTDWFYGGGTETYAAYAQADFKATEKLTLTAGLRYTKEKKTFQRYVHQLAAAGAEITGSGWRDGGADELNPVLPDGVRACFDFNRDMVCTDTEFSDTTPTVSVAYAFTDKLNVYARYAEGYKSGGYNGETNLMAEVETPYKPTTQKSYEVGVKSVFWDNRLQLNAAVFENKLTDMQLSVFPGGLSVATLVKNPGKATIKGFELEAALQLTPGWYFQAGYGYLDAGFDEYLDTPPGATEEINVANNRAFPHAPKHTFNLNFDVLLWRTSVGNLRLLGDFTYTAENYYYPYPLVPEDPAVQQTASNTLIPARGIANAKLLLSDVKLGGSGNAEISLWVRNLTDKVYMDNIVDFGPGFGGLTQAQFGLPRTYGAEFTYRW